VLEEIQELKTELQMKGYTSDWIGTVIDWEFGPTGLVLGGDPGCGKTRIVGWLLRRLAIDERRSIAILDAAGLCGTVESGRRTFLEKDVVCVDLGRTYLNAMAVELVRDMITRRWTTGKPSLLVSACRGDILNRQLTKFGIESFTLRTDEFRGEGNATRRWLAISNVQGRCFEKLEIGKDGAYRH
jgi:hypothetical protein